MVDKMYTVFKTQHTAGQDRTVLWNPLSVEHCRVQFLGSDGSTWELRDEDMTLSLSLRFVKLREAKLWGADSDLEEHFCISSSKHRDRSVMFKSYWSNFSCSLAMFSSVWSSSGIASITLQWWVLNSKSNASNSNFTVSFWAWCQVVGSQTFVFNSAVVFWWMLSQHPFYDEGQRLILYVPRYHLFFK